jgi:hypothetical protein
LIAANKSVGKVALVKSNPLRVPSLAKIGIKNTPEVNPKGLTFGKPVFPICPLQLHPAIPAILK